MGKPFEPAQVEEVESAVKTKQETMAEVLQEKPVTLLDVQCGLIDDFITFIKGNKGFADPNERIDYQVRFISSVFPSMLSNPLPTSLETIKYFVKQLRLNKDSIGINLILAPVMSASSQLRAPEVERYQYTINILYRIATTSDKEQVIRAFDTVSLLNQWEETPRTALYNYLFG